MIRVASRLLTKLFGRWHAHAMWDGRGMLHRHVIQGRHPIEYRQAHYPPEA